MLRRGHVNLAAAKRLRDGGWMAGGGAGDVVQNSMPARVGAGATSPLPEADFFLAAATLFLAGRVEPTATRSPCWPRLAAAPLGGMVEWRTLRRESLETCGEGTSLR